MEKIPLSKLLEYFSVQELSDALFQANLPQTGTKTQKIERLCSQIQKPLLDLLELFTAEALRIVCDTVGIRSSRKDDMISGLLSLLENGAAIPVQGEPVQPTYLLPTKEAVMGHFKQLTVPARKAHEEIDAQYVIGDHLAEVFEDVHPQYNIGGYLGLKIDIDIGNGKVGVEVKLADSLLKSAAEIQRLIGQSIYYQKKRYLDNLIIAIVGRREDLEDPMLKETYSFLEGFNITCVRVPVS